MAVCSICKSEAERLFKGRCTACLAQMAVDLERHSLDAENQLPEYEINSDLGDNVMDAFRVGQGNFGPKAKQEQEDNKHD